MKRSEQHMRALWNEFKRNIRIIRIFEEYEGEFDEEFLGVEES